MGSLEELKTKYNAELVFFNKGEKIEKTGDVADDTLKQTVVVLKQSLDTAECRGTQYIEFYNDNNKLLMIFQDDSVYGFIVNHNVENIKIEKEKKEEEKKGKVVVKKERKKIKIKGKDKKEEKKIEKVQEEAKKIATSEIMPKYNITTTLFDDVKQIATEFLEDFAEDIVNNLIKELKINTNNVSSATVDSFLKRLNKSSSLIIGPSSAKEMITKIKEKISL